ncbi:unnamed protein product [Calypogeia fissa]
MLHGYMNAFPGFQLLLCDDDGKAQPLTDEIRSSWDPCWVEANNKFEAECDANPLFDVLKDRIFPMADGNHRLFLWMAVSKQFPHEKKFHPRVIAKFLAGSDKEILEIVGALQAFNS